jgi:hypothetical protein
MKKQNEKNAQTNIIALYVTVHGQGQVMDNWNPLTIVLPEAQSTRGVPGITQILDHNIVYRQ